MAAAGIAGGFFAAARGVTPRMLRIAMGVAAGAAALAPVSGAMAAALLIAAATGAALGVATVGLAALLPAWCGVAWVGLGTGLGYAACNLPVVFLQSPAGQAWIGAGFALVGLLAVPAHAEWREKSSRAVFPLWGAVAVFTALVWLDSAAFFIIQHTPELKSATWGNGLLWRNAALHLTLAGVAGLWLARGGARMLPGIAWGLLAVAALAVNAEATRGLAGWFYPAGVSLYSAALVAWPGWFSGAAGARPAAWRAAWLFANRGLAGFRQWHRHGTNTQARPAGFCRRRRGCRHRRAGSIRQQALASGPGRVRGGMASPCLPKARKSPPAISGDGTRPAGLSLPRVASIAIRSIRAGLAG